MTGNTTSEKFFLRNVIGDYMLRLGEADSRVLVVNADLMRTCRNEAFVRKYPRRAFNVGIAEQNMVSFAAGLACEGFLPYVFSMAPFISMRACEQCRTDVAYGNRRVRMIGVYAGVSGGISGATHWGLEDCGIMTAIPGMTVMELSDPAQTRAILDLSLTAAGPMYLRCGIEPVAALYPSEADVRVGGSRVIHPGDDGAILCAGVTVQYALEAAVRIAEKTGKHIRVVDLYSIKPIDRERVIAAAGTGIVAVAQDHNIIGGLGSAVAQVIAGSGLSPRFRILGIPDRFVPMAHADCLYRNFGYDAQGIEACVTQLLKEAGTG